MRSIRLVVIDIDGTLLTPDKVLTTKAIQAAEQLRTAGIEFTVTSGRPPKGMAMLVAPLRLTGPIAAFNGGMWVKPDLSSVLEQKPLSLSVAIEATDYLMRAGVDVWVYRESDWYVRCLDAPHVEREERTVRFAPTVVRDVRGVLEGAIKIVGVSDDVSRLASCESELRDRVLGFASVSRSQPYYLDVTHPEANKGEVVRFASRIYRVPLEQIATIGDMPNDVLMFGVAGMSIAMGNASPEVQRTARFVTLSNEREGFAYAMHRFVLKDDRGPRISLGLPSRVRACLFDLDGVLTETAKIHARAWKMCFDAFLETWSKRHNQAFKPFDAIHDYAKFVDGKLRIDGARAFLASRGIHLPEREIQTLAEQKDEILLKLLRADRVHAFAGSVRYARLAREAGLKTAVVSSSKHCTQMLVSAGIKEFFDAQVDGNVASSQHLAGKPSPDTYLAAARVLGVPAEEAAVFEDAISGVQAGRAGHFGYVVGVDRENQRNELLRHGADTVVSDVADLIGEKDDSASVISDRTMGAA